jgi:hypothetical protein
VLIHELSIVLAKRLASAGRRLAMDTFAFRGREAQVVGWMLAKGLDVLVSQDWPKAEVNLAEATLARGFPNES